MYSFRSSRAIVFYSSPDRQSFQMTQISGAITSGTCGIWDSSWLTSVAIPISKDPELCSERDPASYLVMIVCFNWEAWSHLLLSARFSSSVCVMRRPFRRWARSHRSSFRLTTSRQNRDRGTVTRREAMSSHTRWIPEIFCSQKRRHVLCPHTSQSHVFNPY